MFVTSCLIRISDTYRKLIFKEDSDASVRQKRRSDQRRQNEFGDLSQSEPDESGSILYLSQHFIIIILHF